MAEVNTGSEGGGKKGGKVHAKKLSTRIDMTPMVDLAFLLLTFFMLTATFNKPQTLEINMPAEGEPQEIPKDLTTTFLISDDNKLFYYDGMFDPANPAMVKKTDFSKDGIRKLLMDKNSIVINKIDILEEKLKNKEIEDTVYKQQVAAVKKDIKANKGRIVVIKPEGDAAFESIVNILDEMAITNVVSFAIVEISPEEKAVLATL